MSLSTLLCVYFQRTKTIIVDAAVTDNINVEVSGCACWKKDVVGNMHGQRDLLKEPTSGMLSHSISQAVKSSSCWAKPRFSFVCFIKVFI